jgi:flagellar motor switch protein FliM
LKELASEQASSALLTATQVKKGKTKKKIKWTGIKKENRKERGELQTVLQISTDFNQQISTIRFQSTDFNLQISYSNQKLYSKEILNS